MTSRTRKIVGGVAFVLCALLLLLYYCVEKSSSPQPLKEISVGLLPNVITALAGVFVAAVLLPRILEESALKRYIDALKPVRRALRQKVDEGAMEPSVAQEIMRTVVAGASLLHFGTQTPPEGGEDHESLQCTTCTLTCDLKNGACSLCHDPEKAWRAASP